MPEPLDAFGLPRFAAVVVGCGLTAACAAASPTSESAAETPPPAATGGTLSIETTRPTTEVVGDELHVWGYVEAPAASRRQAVQSMAAAVARAELSKFLQVRVQSLTVDNTADNAPNRIAHFTQEITAFALPRSPPPEFGWTIEDLKIRMVARVAVPLATLKAAFETRGDNALANRFIDEVRR